MLARVRLGRITLRAACILTCLRLYVFLLEKGRSFPRVRWIDGRMAYLLCAFLGSASGRISLAS